MQNVHCKILGEWCQYLPLNCLATKKEKNNQGTKFMYLSN